MALTVKHALPLDSNLISYLTAMTCSWTRKKIPIQSSNNGLAFWNGYFIGIPDFRYSSYTFAVDYPLEQQFSFYSALAFHESMHAKFGSHKADKYKILNHPIIPSNLKNLALFIVNIIEDGRIERLGLIKREKSVIHHQLYRLNLLISESNWANYYNISFSNDFDIIFNHLINQLFDLTLLGKNFLKDTINRSEKEILNQMVPILNNVFTSYDPNESIEATIKLFEIFHELSNENYTDLQNIHIPTFQNRCDHSDSYHSNENNQEFDFDLDSLNLDDLREFLNNPFSNLFNENENNSDPQEVLEDANKSDQESREGKNNEGKQQKRKFRKKKSNKKTKEYTFEHDLDKKKEQFRLIPKSSLSKESTAYNKYIKHSQSNSSYDLSDSLDSDDYEIIDTFGNDMSVSEANTVFNFVYKDLEELADNYYDDEFDDTYNRLQTIAERTANYFLQLAGINIKKKDGVGNQKIILSSQKDGKLQLNGNTLSQLLAGNKYIYNKEMPAKINISLDLIILVDLTGSMECNVFCDGRSASRIEFINEATVVLGELFHILQDIYNLPLTYSIIGYSAPDTTTPVLEIMKSFTDKYEGKTHAKAILSWYPDGENCDARAIYESVKLLESNNSLSSNKIIFFLSDGGGEETDNFVKQKIKKDIPNFQFTGPKDYTDAIRYATASGISTYIFNLEQFNNSSHGYDMIQAFRRYYGENISLVENLGDIVDIFTKCLLEIFKSR